MPLDSVARRYAKALLLDAEEKSGEKFVEDLASLQVIKPIHPAVVPGAYSKGLANAYLAQIRFVTEAWMKSLIEAYEKSGIRLDEYACKEIKSEVMQFCHEKQHLAVSAVGQYIGQTFRGSQPRGLEKPVLDQIITGVDEIMARCSRYLSMRRDETLLDDIRVHKAYAAGLGKKWDVFVSHASEDKDSFVRLLANALAASGLSVWYDESTLKVGDSLRRKIEEGLANSRYGIVVLSEHFFAKNWPQNELDGLVSREVAGSKVILPVWHKIEFAEVQRRSPMLSGRIAAKSSDGIDKVVSQLRDAMGL